MNGCYWKSAIDMPDAVVNALHKSPRLVLLGTQWGQSSIIPILHMKWPEPRELRNLPKVMP